jgi:hypothetical protein
LNVPDGFPALAVSEIVPLIVSPFFGLQITTLRFEGAGKLEFATSIVTVWLIVPCESLAVKRQVW